MIECTCGSRRNGDGPQGKKYYRCVSRHQHYDRINRCTVGGINVNILDQLVWNQLQDLLTKPSLVKAQAQRWLSEQNKSSDSLDTLDTATKQLRATENEQRRYVDAYGKGNLPEYIFNEKMESTNAILKLLREKIEKASQNRGEAVKISVDQLVSAVNIEIEQLDFKSKRDIAERVVEKIIADPKEVKIWGHLPVNLEKVKYEPINRHRGPTQRRQINIIQRTHKQ